MVGFSAPRPQQRQHRLQASNTADTAPVVPGPLSSLTPAAAVAGKKPAPAPVVLAVVAPTPVAVASVAVIDVPVVVPAAFTVRTECVPALTLLASQKKHDVFLTAVQAAGLGGKFNSAGDVQTLFAPTDDAFVAMLQTQGLKLSQLVAQPDTLRKVSARATNAFAQS